MSFISSVNRVLVYGQYSTMPPKGSIADPLLVTMFMDRCGVRERGEAHLIQRRLLFLIKSMVLSNVCLLTLWLNVSFPYKSI